MVLAAVVPASAQGRKAVRINEVMVVNDSSMVDEYGRHSAWIELFNSNFAPVEISSMFITNDKNNPKKYMIPKGDVLTKVPPRQHILFWADNEPSRGTFHTNFTLEPDKDNYIALYDSDGTTLIDEITIPAGQKADISYGLTLDGGDTWAVLPKVTPSTNNITLDSNEKLENFQRNDSLGIGMTITAMAVVFLGLLILFLVFKQIGKWAIAASKRNAAKSGEVSTVEVSGEVYAAIATALYEFGEDTHDVENTVLTIQKVKRNYSPWSSKIYSLREEPRRK